MNFTNEQLCLIEKVFLETKWVSKDTIKKIFMMFINEPHTFVEVCPDSGMFFGECTRGQIGYLCGDAIHYKDCLRCKGHGVIPKQQQKEN